MKNYTPNPANDSVITVETDGTDPPDATTFNTPVESLSDTAAYLRQRIIGASSANWRYQAYPTGGLNPLAVGTLTCVNNAVWDPVYNRWVVPFNEDYTGSYGLHVLQSPDGVSWELEYYDNSYILNSSVAAVGVIISPSDGQQLWVWYDGSNAHTGIYTPSTGGTSFTGTSQPWVGWVGGPSYYVGTRIGSTWSVWQTAVTSTNPVFSNNGTTWGNCVFSPPAGFHIGLSVVCSQGIGIFDQGHTGTGITKYMFSSDGTNYSQQNMPILLTGETVTGVTYDAFSGLVYLQVSNRSSGGRVFTSPTLSSPTWTLAYTASSILLYPGFSLNTLQSNGRELVDILPYGKLVEPSLTTISRLTAFRSIDGMASFQACQGPYILPSALKSISTGTPEFVGLTATTQGFGVSNPLGLATTYNDALPPTVTV